MTGVTETIGGGARLLRLDAPDSMLSMDGIAELTAMLSRPANAQERLIILAGGTDFCLGRKPGPPPAGASSNLSVRDGVAKPILALYDAVVAAPLPVAAAVRGRATGFGCALAAMCDLVLATPDAEFSLPEFEKGVPPTLAMRALARRADAKAMIDWILTGRSFGADEALACGIVSRIVPDPEAELASLAVTLATRSVRALASIKTYLAALDGQFANAGLIAAELIAAALAEAKE